MIDSCKETNSWIKQIQNYENYFLTKNGMIWSKSRNQWMNYFTDKDGYKVVYLSKNSKSKNFRVHRLVYSTFVRPLKKGEDCHHINEMKDDNRVENLYALEKGKHTILHHQGKKHTEEWRIQHSKDMTGKVHSQQSKRKLSEKMKQYWRRRNK